MSNEPEQVVAPPPFPVFTDTVYCIKCGYCLRGLEQSGQCPECGGAYDASTVARHQAPSTVAIILRFGWPLVAYVGALLLMLTPFLDSDFGVAYLFTVVPALLLACFVNVPVQYRMLRRRGVLVPREGDRSIRRLMIIMSVISIVGPFVVFGGCLALIF